MEQTIQSNDLFNNQDIKYKKSLSISAIIYLIATAAFVYVYAYLTETSDATIRILLLVAGITTFCIGIIKLINGHKQLICAKTGVPIKDFAIFFEPHELNKVQHLLETKQLNNILNLKHFSEDNCGVKMDVLISDDSSYAAAQLSEYKPFSYDRVTPIMNFSNEDAAFFANLKNKKA